MLNFAPKIEEKLFGLMSGPYNETLLIKINFNYVLVYEIVHLYTCKMQNKAIHLPTYVDKVVFFNILGQNDFKHCD